MSLTFFYKRTFTTMGTYKKKHLSRVSSMIRGDQIAEYLGAKINPTSGYEDDICIYVKPGIKPVEPHIHEFTFAKNSYVDIIDGFDLRHVLRYWPHLKAIVCSKDDEEILAKYIENQIVFIPQHHCNFDRIHRERNEITRIGTIGTFPAFSFIPEEIRKAIADRKMEYVEFWNFRTRQDIIEFYKKIDIQLVWRPYRKYLSNPLKLVNASSFGIPTIALDETAFKEMGDCYFPVTNAAEFVSKLDEIKRDPHLYEDYSQRCLNKSEEYHIENVAKLYRQLT